MPSCITVLIAKKISRTSDLVGERGCPKVLGKADGVIDEIAPTMYASADALRVHVPWFTSGKISSYMDRYLQLSFVIIKNSDHAVTKKYNKCCKG